MTIVHPRKKVLYLITKSNWGGAQRYVYDLATGLDKTRFEAVVALGGNGTLAELLTHAGIRTISIESLQRDISLESEKEFTFELWRILQSEKPEVLHVNSSKAAGVGTLLGRLAGVPRIIFTAHGWAFNEDRPLWQRIAIKLLHWLTVLLSHRTIAVSHSILKQMNLPFAQNKMKVINPGRVIGVMYDKKEARTKITDFCPRLSSHLTAPWIITIAELHPIKRIDTLITAMQDVIVTVPNAKSIIIGDGELHSELELLIKERGLEETVFLAGSITEAARFLKAGDVFVLPSKSESYGYVIHEAGLAGIPVVATNVGGVPDIISTPNEGLLIPPDTPGALAKAIRDTLSDQTASHDRAARLQKKLLSRSTEHMVIATSALYELSLN
jgi:glycosyltransferase involved in cell wall biosynthesis